MISSAFCGKQLLITLWNLWLNISQLLISCHRAAVLENL